MLRLKSIIILIIMAAPSLTLAEYRKGFNEGPYLRIIGGMVGSTFDDNARTGEKVANDYEGAYGFQFGWNMWDETAPELEVRYATKKIRDNREHIVNVNLNVKYSFLTNALTGIFGTLNILPYVQGGPAGMIAAVPGDTASTDRLLTVWGLGFGGGAGIDFLVKKYIYFGILLQSDILYIPSASQMVNGSRQKIIAGGWEPILALIGAAGVHF